MQYVREICSITTQEEVDLDLPDPVVVYGDSFTINKMPRGGVGLEVPEVEKPVAVEVDYLVDGRTDDAEDDGKYDIDCITQGIRSSAKRSEN